MLTRKQNWIHAIQHVVFRFVSVIFSGGSAYSINWFFSVLNGTDPVQRWVTVSICIGFVVLGYFVTRGLAHRLMNKQRILAYAFIGALYVFVEVVCNYGHAAAHFPDVTWVQQLHGAQYTFFSYALPIVLSILPLFNVALAWIDMDLMREKMSGASAGMMSFAGRPAAPVAMPKPGRQGPVTLGGPPTTQLNPQASLPTMPHPGGSNALGNFWNKVSAGQTTAPQAPMMMGGQTQGRP